MAQARNFPGMTKFQRENMGKPVTGFSGILPFYRTRDGHIRTPGGPTGTVFRKN